MCTGGRSVLQGHRSRLEHIMLQVFSIMLYFSANRITVLCFPHCVIILKLCSNYAHSMFPNHAVTIAFFPVIVEHRLCIV